MRRPLFAVCLCIVATVAIRLWLFGPPGQGEKTTFYPSDGEIVTVTGRVYKRDAQSFYLHISSIAAVPQQDIPETKHNSKQDLKKNISRTALKNIICEYPMEESGVKTSEMVPLIGSDVTVRGTYQGFHPATNPGEFDMAEYYEVFGISGRLKKVSVSEYGQRYSLLLEKLFQLRESFRKRIFAVFPKKEASVMTAILLGDKSELDSEVKELYQRNGIIHILSISGLHITLIGMGIYRLLRRMGLPVWVAALGGSMVLGLYGVMTGMGVSACRAVGMYLIRMFAEVAGRAYDMLTALGAMAVILVCKNPVYLRYAGFLLSFGAVMGIGLTEPVRKRIGVQKREKKKKRIRYFLGKLLQTIIPGAAITLFTLPVQLWFYYEIPVYSIFLNLLVLPLMSLLMVTGLVVMLLPGTGILGTLSYLILLCYEKLCGIFDELPFHTWNPGRPQVWQIILYYILLFFLLYLLQRREEKRIYDIKWMHKMQYACTPILLVAAVFLLTVKISTGARVTFLDVGQGDGVILETKEGEVFLFDCGSSSRKKVGQYVLLPYLKYRGIRHVNAMFLSHPDEDHVSGAKELLELGAEEGITVGQIILPGIARMDRQEQFADLQGSIDKSGQDMPITVSYVQAGNILNIKGMSLLCLHPPSGYISEDANAFSECFFVELYGKRKEGKKQTAMTLLLTGDVEDEGETLFLEEIRKRGIGNITVLKVAHHGSRYSTSESFLKITKPEIGVISSSSTNRYGHPHEDTLSRLEKVNCKTWCTKDVGAVTVSTDGNEVWVERFR